MKPSCVLILMLLLAGVLAGCFENPLYDDDCCWEPVTSEDTPPPPGPPAVSATATMVSGVFVTRHGGTMTVSVRVSNAAGVEPAYDIRGWITVTDGQTVIGSVSVYLGDLDANQWTETSVDLSISVYPSLAARMTLELTWLDMYDNVYESHINGSTLFKTVL